MKIEDLVAKGKRNHYRKSEERKEQKKKKEANAGWFRKGTNGNRYETVLFVEATPESELLNAIKAVEETFKIDENKRIKVVEKSGRKLIENIRVTDPFRKNCKEEDCLACKSADKFTNCRKNNIGYTIQCKTCKTKGKTRVYRGESSRNLFQRQREHIKQLQKRKESSVLLRHIKEEHKEETVEEVEFTAEVSGTFKKPLERITHEGVMIANTKDDELINTKKEFFKPSVRKKS